ncbi:DENN domain-containing protein 11 isoform X3 [Narcine bancroftii]|uniref:DENN domain-containing protein 11 isoform X3 n=1 Tax=Narcine bancroftii TaxID=1343680 RepID=UPI0038311B31
MADRAPLLEHEEGPAVAFPPALDPGSGLEGEAGSRSIAERWSPGPGGPWAAEAAPHSESEHEEEEQVVAVFVVTFDTRAGNIVEWRLPQEVDLEGVEFKSMASGSHRINSDFVYFRKGNYFGIACFANMPVESELERGARMKSVGILSPSYTLLYRYMHFLENQVRRQLEIPGHYAQLEAFYEDKKGILPAGLSSKGMPTSFQPLHWLPSVNKYMYPEMKITHPAGCMSQFIKFFGEQIMVLWKFALLRKRILIFSPPPVGVVCYRGTTEKIFEEKKDLYDIYIDNQNVKTEHEHLQQLLKVNSADKDKYRKLNDQRQMLLYSQEVGGDCNSNEEDLFIMFFMEQNNRIFQMLLEVSACQDKTLTADHPHNGFFDFRWHNSGPCVEKWQPQTPKVIKSLEASLALLYLHQLSN